MNLDALYELIKISLTEGFMVMAPIMIVTLMIGITISILQTVTSIQEQTLSFVPKLLGAAAVIWLMAPWMLQRMGSFTTLFIQRAAEVVR